MYPATIFNWYDQSQINTGADINALDSSPLFMVVSSFDKGPEDLMEVSGSTFNDLFGKMYFEKHGQNAIQAQKIINAGGRLLVKRVCADDATISNVIMVATITTTSTQKKNDSGEDLYLDADGEETTSVTSDPIMVNSSVIKWEAKNVSGCKTFEEVKEKALELFDASSHVYPLMVFVDNGRGVSGKAIRIIPDYNTSKSIGSTFYTASVFEGTASVEAVPMTFNPISMYSGKAYGLTRDTLSQLNCEAIESVYSEYVADIADTLGLDVDTVKSYDLIFGYTFKGASIPGLTVDREGVDLNSAYGIELKGGSNGAFGDKPVNTPAWTEAIRQVYAGEVTDEVWDVDQHKIAAIVDANLPVVVKEAIAAFVNFRKDCMFFRDYGLDVDTFIQINSAKFENKTKSYFIADYATTYDVKDPITKKRIKVTMLYDFAECLVDHLSTTPYNPLAGTANSFILREAIKGSINYTPIVTPSVNQKQAMDDLRVNYAIFEGDNCVVQTLYTSQEPYTQLSYANNVLGIQQVLRAVRTACPKNRYKLITSYDMSNYAKAVNNVLSGFKSNFDVLRFKYTQDPLKAAQKIFYASIEFAFNMWAQTEIFDVFAINNEE